MDYDKSLICKLMNETRYNSDSIILESIKRVNQLITDRNLDWNSIVIPHIPNDKDLKKRERIVNYLGYTQASDGESLNALKMVNDLLSKENLVWNQVLPDSLLAAWYPVSMDSPELKKSKKSKQASQPTEPKGQRGSRGLLQIEILEVMNQYNDWVQKSEVVKRVVIIYGRNSGAVYRQITTSQPTSKWVKTGNLVERGLIEQNGDKIRLRRDS
ncbi:MAG: hypothetical protein O8C67_07205 [Candidatus Methanoperedens sp.]|nr:hypothetical protein [Candidatus Methanoperedens sp.]